MHILPAAPHGTTDHMSPDHAAVPNDQPRPFVWHKTADDILDTLAAYCDRISDSGH